MAPHTLASDVAAEVRAEAARQRVSHRRIAEELGLSQAVLSARMCGHTEFRLSELALIARLLDVPVARFMPAAPDEKRAA